MSNDKLNIQVLNYLKVATTSDHVRSNKVWQALDVSGCFVKLTTVSSALHLTLSRPATMLFRNYAK